MKNKIRFISLFIAVFLILGSTSFIRNSFAVNSPEPAKGRLALTKCVKDYKEGDPYNFTFTFKGIDGTEGTFDIHIIHGQQIFFLLPYGTYLLTEELPDGYKNDLSPNGLEPNRLIVLVDKDNGHDIVVTNEKISNPDLKELKIQKQVVGEDGQIIEGADLSGFTFTLYLYNEGTSIGETIVGSPLTTGPSGLINFGPQENAKYTLYEEHVDGYEMGIGIYGSGKPKQIEVKPGNPDTYIVKNTLLRNLTAINVQKKVIGLKDLSGFTFRLYSKNLISGEEMFIKEVSTGPSGLISFGDQPEGKYVLYEDDKEGFEMGLGVPGSNMGREIDHPEQTKEPIEVENTKIPGSEIEVTKIVQDEDGKVIPGDNGTFKFILEKLLDETWIEQDRKTRVGNGTVRFNYLNDAKYRVREVNIPTGYTLITPNDVEVSIYELESKNVEFRNQLDFTPPPPPPEDEPRIPEIPDRPDRPDIPERDIPEMKPEPEPDPIIPTVPEIIVVPEPIPESKPEREPKVEAEELVIEEEQVVAEPVPKAKPVSTLPKTGAANPLMTSGFGAILLAAGWYLRKKED